MKNTKLILILGSSLKILALKDNAIEHSEEHHLDNNEIIDGIIFNITKIERLIANVLTVHQLANLSTTILLDDELIIQSLNQNLKLDPKIYHLKSYELQFYPHQVFYNLGIKHYQLFQYHLLCAKLSIELESIITPLLHLYRLFKTRSYKKIDPTILTVESLKIFLKDTITQSQLNGQICNPIKNFDTILSMYQSEHY